jgi:glycosyltransferase involved in cell wall biosynthesis
MAMDQSSVSKKRPPTIALIGNHLPRQCGIGTFTTDLLAIDTECWAVVMNDVPEGYDYPSQVRFEINYKNLADYRLAADFLNMNQVDVVCLQHEFGIFGGTWGNHILELIRNLRMPLVTTLHTVLKSPNEQQKKVVEEIGHLSDRLIVMSYHAIDILQKAYDVDEKKIVMIPHGIPDVPFVDPSYYKDQFGVEGRKVIFTFGLLSPGKGVEHMIDALPAITEKHPDAVYVVLGMTHPHIRRVEGESYRMSLQLRAKELEVEEHLIFHNRFVTLKELCEFLGAADIYVTPYLNREQIVSGTLAYALGAGKAIVSTPYWYAEEMLDEERGRLVPFGNSETLAAQVIDLFDHDIERHAIRKRAYTFAREMIWKRVAQHYLEVFFNAKRKRQQRPKFQAKTLESNPYEMPPILFDHLYRLTDDVGVLQHAKFIVPNRLHGYCTDDNARALIAVMMAHELTLIGDEIVDLAYRYLSFLQHAFNRERGRFRNFMNYERRWLEEEGSEDSHCRALWSLGMTVAMSKSEGLTGVALNLFERALPAIKDFEHPRSWAFSLIGIHAYLRRFSGDSEVRRIREKLALQLFDRYKANATESWPWIDQTLTYANAKIPHALLLSGRWIHHGEMVAAGIRALEWLCQLQTDPKGHFIPIGNSKWFSRGGDRARFDQQPIEAQTMIEACLEAYNITNDTKWCIEAQRCFDWFMGRNDLDKPLYDFQTGGCCDGLTTNGPNRNQGAESTLAWLISLLNMHELNNTRSERERT